MVGSEDNIYAFGQTSGSEEKLRAASERPDLKTLGLDLNLKLSQQVAAASGAEPPRSQG